MKTRKTILPNPSESETIAAKVASLVRWLNAVSALAECPLPQDADLIQLTLCNEAFQKFSFQAKYLLEAPEGLPKC